MYHYSAYWRVWSRVLKVEGFRITEISLTPINGWERGDLNEIREQQVRCHSTARGKGDIETDTLPWAIVWEMVRHLGEGTTERLLTHDYLGEQVEVCR
jgi:hypothetical protein